MIFTPWALGLTLCSIIVLLLLFKVAVSALIILIKGEKNGYSRFTLSIEKQEMLYSAVLRLAFLYFVLSPFLLIAAAFDLGKQIPGAMCALGTFNANKYGFSLILIRLTTIFVIVSWLVLYSLDMNNPITPFRNIRRYLIIFTFFWILTDTIIQTLFFNSLNVKIITSCCAVVFDPTGTFEDNFAGIFAKFPSCNLYFKVSVIYLLAGFFSMSFKNKVFRILYYLFAPLFFLFSLFAITSCVSPYIYALPYHHCPFCILTGKEALIGIPLMVFLYLAAIFGWSAGIADLACNYEKISCNEIKWIGFTRIGAFVLNLIFVSISGLAVYPLFLWLRN